MPPLSQMQLPYALLDVFAEQPLEGNMLAVFTDARGLSTETMQALARETNLAETTFILPADDPRSEIGHGVRVRIFTTEEELPFAGHPTLGTAAWLHGNHPHLRGAEAITLQLAGGPVTVRFEPEAAGVDGVFGTMRQADAIFGALHDPATVAALLGVPLAALDGAFPIQTVSTGLPFAIVPFRSIAGLQQLSTNWAAARAYLAGTDARFFFSLAPSPSGSPAQFRARMQFCGGEDPATGSAAGCAVAYLLRYGRILSDAPIRLEQGVEIRRPSQLHLRATQDGTHIRDVFVGGRTIPVASGHFFLPADLRFPHGIVTKQQH